LWDTQERVASLFAALEEARCPAAAPLTIGEEIIALVQVQGKLVPALLEQVVSLDVRYCKSWRDIAAQQLGIFGRAHAFQASTLTPGHTLKYAKHFILCDT
jgi:hypothetical protein